MEDLRQKFLKEIVHNLENLQSELQNQQLETIPTEFRQRFFRCVHSIKGTAQTFNLKNLSYLAHEIENFLQAINDDSVRQTEEIKPIIAESLLQFIKCCRQQEYQPPKEFYEKVALLISTDGKVSPQHNLNVEIPKSLLVKLSTKETKSLEYALLRGKSFYLIEVFFDVETFHQKFIDFRHFLSEKGEIIAVSPAEKSSANGIGFQFFYVTELQSLRLSLMIAPFNAKIDFENGSEIINHSADLNGVLENLIIDCQKKARILEKKINFEVLNQIKDVPRQTLILINHSLLHLLRNAVDHAIETPEIRLAANKTPTGKVIISIFQKDNDLILRIEDDGRGIDIENLKIQAQKYGIITDDQILDENETLYLIFAHGFSTSERISDISGRGIGLDIAKDLVERIGGKITVESKVGYGTAFEIKLPFQEFTL